MEALAALGLAAAVVQFVDYSTGLVSKGRQIYYSSTGALAENTEMEEASKRLQALTEPLQIPTEDEAIATICKKCIEISKELSIRLNKLKVPSGHRHKKWKSFRQALKSTASKEKIKDIKQRLEALRAELDTHVVLNIREKVSAFDIKLDSRFISLDTRTQDIIQRMLDLPRIIREDTEQQFQYLVVTERLEHNRTRAVVVDQAQADLEIRVQHALLESLRFPMITVRHDTIPVAHQRTFEWIFQAPDLEGRTWSNFGEWLVSGSGVYWINGKAGSGKSTLMKFVLDHDITREKLSIWASNGNFQAPSFFFWKSGSPVQRSQEGLLRSLLIEVLEKHVDLIQEVCSKEWVHGCNLARNNLVIAFSSWTLTKLKKALSNLIDASADHLRLCFFIDGLDEYEGAHEEIAEYFSTLSTHSSVKLCVSSRPWPAFTDAFQGRPHLRLQDLTRNDIQRYVEDKVNSNIRMQNLKQKEPRQSKWLVETLTWKADGVFLWVTLVVKSLLKGLSHRNSIEILHQRLQAMPSDLENLYDHMFSSIDPAEMGEGSRVFQLCEYECNKYSEIIYHALKGRLQESLHMPLPDSNSCSVSGYEESKHVNRVELILQTRCGGLLEMTFVGGKRMGRLGKLQPIHRTASEYLRSPKIRSVIQTYSLHSNPSWNVNVALCVGAILRLKHGSCFTCTADQNKQRVFDMWRGFSVAIKLVQKSAHFSTEEIARIIDEFDKSASHSVSGTPWFCEANMEYPWSAVNFLSVVAEARMWFYLENKFERQPSLLTNAEVPLFACFLFPPSYSSWSWSRRDAAEFPRTMELLLRLDTTCSTRFLGYSCWQYWVTLLHTMVTHSGYEDMRVKAAIPILKQITVSFLLHEPELDICCIHDWCVWRRIFSDSTTRHPQTIFHITMPDLKNHHREPWLQSNHLASSATPLSGSGTTSVIERSPLSNRISEEEDDQWTGSELDSDNVFQTSSVFEDEEHLSFEERHSLKAVIRDVFNTEEDPNGANELLQLIGNFELEKASKQAGARIKLRKRQREEETEESDSTTSRRCVSPNAGDL